MFSRQFEDTVCVFISTVIRDPDFPGIGTIHKTGVRLELSYKLGLPTFSKLRGSDFYWVLGVGSIWE